jgi:predicted dithiol-disulfide oxidoreductase (DUF899 family)
MMEKHNVVSSDEWLTARRELLAKEKEFTRLRDELSAQRRALPWERVTKQYVFDTPQGPRSLAELFAGRGQLIVYHFMFHPSWNEGCPSCSFWADNFKGIIVHLRHRDVTLVAVSKARLEQIEAFKKRMGWDFTWASSFANDFNRDLHVSFTPEEMERKQVFYNYRVGTFPREEAVGISVFYRDGRGEIFHTYSCYSRGVDMLNVAYHYLDLVPKGRNEDALSFSQAWVRHHDKYDD